MTELAGAAKAFLAKVEELTPRIDELCKFAYVHNYRWAAEDNWVKERDALREALREEEDEHT